MLPVKKKKRDELWSEGASTTSPNVISDGEVRLCSRIKDQPCDVLLGHAGQLVREHVLEADEPHQDPLVGLLVQGVTDNVEFNHPPALL